MDDPQLTVTSFLPPMWRCQRIRPISPPPPKISAHDEPSSAGSPSSHPKSPATPDAPTHTPDTPHAPGTARTTPSPSATPRDPSSRLPRRTSTPWHHLSGTHPDASTPRVRRTTAATDQAGSSFTRPDQRESPTVGGRAVVIVQHLPVGQPIVVAQQLQLPPAPAAPVLSLAAGGFQHRRPGRSRCVPATLPMTMPMSAHEADSPSVRTSREVVRTGLFGWVHVDSRGLFTDSPLR